MFILRAFVVVALIALVAGGGGDKDGKWKEKHKKMKKCMEDTMKLKECCDIPNPEPEDTPCNSHLEGIEEKEEKEKGKAFMCFAECVAIKKKILVDDELDMDEIKKQTKEDLQKLGAEDVTDLALESVDYCKGKLDEAKEKWSKFKDMIKKNKSGEDKDEKKCSFKPGALGFCTMGKIVRECPASRQVKSDECDEIRNSATTIEECSQH